MLQWIPQLPEKLQKTQELHLRLYWSKLACSKLIVTAQFEKDWRGMDYLEGLSGEHLASQKGTWQRSLGLHLSKPQDFWNNVLCTNKTK